MEISHQINQCSSQIVATLLLLTNCFYFYPRIQYDKACSENSPCTNVPIACPVCPEAPMNWLTTFWKYNFISYLQTFHLNNNEALPPFLSELRVITHIKADEEKKMEIKQEKTNLWQVDNNVLSSMSLLELVQDQEFAWQEEEQEGWKRAASNISNISNDHQPLLTKRQ